MRKILRPQIISAITLGWGQGSEVMDTVDRIRARGGGIRPAVVARFYRALDHEYYSAGGK